MNPDSVEYRPNWVKKRKQQQQSTESNLTEEINLLVDDLGNKREFDYAFVTVDSSAGLTNCYASVPIWLVDTASSSQQANNPKFCPVA